jgi:hypothetical protein
MMEVASLVRYDGSVIFSLRILLNRVFSFLDLNGGYKMLLKQKVLNRLTSPVNKSNISIPTLHQSTALLDN